MNYLLTQNADKVLLFLFGTVFNVVNKNEIQEKIVHDPVWCIRRAIPFVTA
jgi:hypothetical protein